MTAPSDSHNVVQAWYALIVFQIQLFAVGVDIAIVTLLVHPIETALRVNDVGFAAITATPVAIGIALGGYPSGVLADTFRRRRMIALGSVLWTIAALIAARADSAPIFFLARLLAGIGTIVPGPAIFSMLTDAFPRKQRAFAISFYSATAAIGGGVGLALCGVLVDTTQRRGTLHVGSLVVLPWQQCFIAVAAMGLVILALVLTVVEPPRMQKAEAVHTANLTATLRIFVNYLHRHWLLWVLLIIGNVVSVTSLVSVGTWGPAFGLRHYGAVGASSIALLGALTAGGSLFGSITGGLLAQYGINRGNPLLLPRMLVTMAALTTVFAFGFPYMPSWLFASIGIAGLFAMASAEGFLLWSSSKKSHRTRFVVSLPA